MPVSLSTILINITVLIDVQLAHKNGVIVTNTPDVLTDDVADLAIALVLAVSRRICEADKYVRDKQWPIKGMMPLTVKVLCYHMVCAFLQRAIMLAL